MGRVLNGTGRLGGLFVLGEAGLGKTSVLGRACGAASRAGMDIGLGRGHPMETALPFGLLAQALDGLGGRGLLDDDRAGAGAAHDRAARFYGVLRWLESRHKRPVLLAFDDLHWADADSLALLGFLCRRIGSLRLRIIASSRSWPPEAEETALSLANEGCAAVERLKPLSRPAADALLQTRLGHRPPADTAARAFELCAGNPLLLQQVAIAVGHGEDLPEVPELGRGAVGAGLLLARFAGLPAAGMRCAQAASVLGTLFLPELAADVAGLTGPEIDLALEALCRSGLVDQSQGAQAAFVHPLFRQALYEDLGGPRRTRLNARAFAAFVARGMEAQAAEHAVQADLAGDLEAVAVLERAGLMARRAGALATAVKRLDAATTLAGDLAGPGLLLAQSDTLLADGNPDRAAAVCERLLSRPRLAGRDRVQALRVLGRALVLTGAHKRATIHFDEAVSLARADDPGTAVEVLLDAALASWFTAGPARALPLARRAKDLARPLSQGQRARAEAASCFIALQAGDPAGPASPEWLASLLTSDLGAEVADLGGAFGAITNYAHAAGLVEQLTESERAFTYALAAAGRVNAPEAMAVLANGRAFTLTRMGRLREALESIDFALSLADLVPLVESFAGVGSAYIRLYMGQLDESARWCERVEAVATARGEWIALLFLWDVLGHRQLRAGAVEAACELYARVEAMVNRMEIAEPCLPPWGLARCRCLCGCRARRRCAAHRRLARPLLGSLAVQISADRRGDGQGVARGDRRRHRRGRRQFPRRSCPAR